MVSVGIDVSKEKSMVCILKPYGEVLVSPQEVIHSEQAVAELAKFIQSYQGEIRIVMEATGAYHLPLLSALQQIGLFVSVINPLAMKKYASRAIRKGKTDKLDAVRIANYGIDNWFHLEEYAPPEAVYGELKILGRQYLHYISMKISCKLTLTSLLDRTMPGIKNLLASTSDNRPEFQRMIADSAKRQFAGVLVYQLDRFARNRYDSATYKNRLKRNGVRIISARENIADDASGILIEGVLESMAEYYSVELAQKVRRGLDINAEKCLATGGNVALGYEIDENKRFVIIEDEAAIVRKIFEMYLSGSTMAEIIKYLNANQVKTSRGNEYNKNSIRTILTNKRYRGIYTYRDKEIIDGMPRIIDDQTFADVQILMEKNKKAPARAKAIEEHYLLTMALFCEYCNAAMVGVCGTLHTGKIHQYYQCVCSKSKKTCTNKHKTVRKAFIEDTVVMKVRATLTPKSIEKIAASVVANCEKERNADTLKRINKLLRENDKATDNLIKALESGKAADVITAQIEKRQNERAELEVQLAKEKIQRPQLECNSVKFFFERFAKGDPNDMDYRRSLVDIFIGRIELGNDRLQIFINAQEGQKIEIPIGELEGSPMGMLVEATGFEPAASWSQTKHSTKLSYASKCLL